MWEAIVVIVSVIGCIASWWNLYNNRKNPVFVEVNNNKKIQVAGIAFTVVIAAVAAYFGWLLYATVCVITAVLDFPIKRAILR